jgi:ribonuclease R
LARKTKPKQPPELPTREAILAFVSEQSGKTGKREIARAFGVKGAQRIGLKRMLKEMAGEGLIGTRRKHIHTPGDLPSVTVLSIEGVDDQGEPIGVPVEWNEEWGSAPRIVVAAEGKRPGSRSRAPGVGDRVLARLTPAGDSGAFIARVIKLLERPPKAAL